MKPMVQFFTKIMRYLELWNALIAGLLYFWDRMIKYFKVVYLPFTSFLTLLYLGEES